MRDLLGILHISPLPGWASLPSLKPSLEGKLTLPGWLASQKAFDTNVFVNFLHDDLVISCLTARCTRLQRPKEARWFMVISLLSYYQITSGKTRKLFKMNQEEGMEINSAPSPCNMSLPCSYNPFARRMNSRTFSGSFLPGAASTPLDTSTA